MNKARFIIVILLLCSMLTAMGEVKIYGKVNDAADNKGIWAATISLMHDSTFVRGTITDSDGHFELEVPTDRYTIEVSYIGYETITQSIDATNSVDLGNIQLHESPTELSEVVVKAKRPLIEQHMDKLVVNVSESALSAGSNGNDIMRRVPGVRIDKDGNIYVNGKSVEIYVDGKPSYMSGQQLKAMLDGTDGTTIDKIEVISNPSAKYDASGQGGIINIKLKRNKSQGLNGMLAATYGGMYFSDVSRWIQTEMVSLNLNYRSKKTYTFGQITQLFTQNDIDVESSRTLPATDNSPNMYNYSKSGYDVDFQYYMLKVGNDWYIDSLNTLGFILQVPYMNVKQNIIPQRSTAFVMLGNDTIDRSRTSTLNHIRVPQHTANINYTHIFSESLERELTANVDYNRYSTKANSNQTTNYETRSLGLDISTNQTIDIYSAKVDFQTKFWRTGMIECGVKYGLSVTDNGMTTDSILNDIFLSRSPSSFRYQEHVAAAYITVAKQFGEHWTVKLGLRGEYTHSHGDWLSADSVTNKSYFNPFPTAYWGYTSSPLGKLHEPVSVSMSYSRRIKRPNYNILNPFITYYDAYSYQIGNTELNPEFNNDVELHLAWTQHMNLTLNFSHTENMFNQRITILPNGVGEMKWVNFGTCTTFGGSLSLTELPIIPKYIKNSDGERERQGAWLSLTVNGGWYRSVSKSNAKLPDGTPEYKMTSQYGSLGGTLTAMLPKDWILTADCNWSSPMTIGYSRNEASYFMNFGVRKMYMKKGLIFNLNFQDVLRSTVYSSHNLAQGDGVSSSYRLSSRNQRIMLSVIWMFGSQQSQRHRRVGDMEELNRLSAGNGVGS